MKCAAFCKITAYRLVNLVLVGGLLALITTSIIAYNTWPIYTVTNIIPQNQAQFPAVTFCGQLTGYKEHVLKVSLISYEPHIGIHASYILSLQF